jgi:hypothetical protein
MLKYNKNRFIINTINEDSNDSNENYLSHINELNNIINNIIILLEKNKMKKNINNNLLNEIDIISINLKNTLNNNLNYI